MGMIQSNASSKAKFAETGNQRLTMYFPFGENLLS